MSNRAVIFDLDGTLLDTLDDIADSANAALKSFGFPEHSRASFRDYLGDGARGLGRKTIPASELSEEMAEEIIDTFVTQYRIEYESRWFNHSKPFPGIPELLDELTRRDIPMAVLSNKRDDFTNKCVAKLLGAWKFQIVRGEREGVPLKPDPKALIAIAGEMGLATSQCIYVGDSEIDVEVAKLAGMQDVAVGWGFRDRHILLEAGASTLIERPMELIEVVEQGSTIG